MSNSPVSEIASPEVQRMLLAHATAPCNANDAMGEIAYTNGVGVQNWQWHREPNGDLWYSRTYNLTRCLCYGTMYAKDKSEPPTTFVYVEWSNKQRTWEPLDMLIEDGVVDLEEVQRLPSRTDFFLSRSLYDRVMEAVTWPAGWGPMIDIDAYDDDME